MCLCTFRGLCVSGPFKVWSDLTSLLYMQIYTYITRKKDIFFITQQYLKTFYKEMLSLQKGTNYLYLFHLLLLFCLLQQLLKSHILIREWDIAIASDFTLLRDPAFDTHRSPRLLMTVSSRNNSDIIWIWKGMTVHAPERGLKCSLSLSFIRQHVV